MTHARADALILFGITGDLARRRLFPALYALAEEGTLDIPLVGVSRSEEDSDSLRKRARASLEEAGVDIDEMVFERFAANLSHVPGDYRDESTYRAIKDHVGERQCTVSYLAIPPDLFDDVIRGLASVGMHHHGRVVVEKPFGRDTTSARELSGIIHRHYPEDRVYRIDHFLGKESLQNLMVFRFSNTMLEPIWNRHYIRGVQITMAEDFGVEDRGSYYDSVGAMRDVVQNHLLVMMSLLAMEPPVSDHPDALRDERVKVLQATESLDLRCVVAGQYRGYRDEPGVDQDSTTETFFAARFEIDSWRWAGVPWIIRTGKHLDRTVTEAVVEFQRPPRLLFSDAASAPGPNRLYFQSKPSDRIVMAVQSKRPGPRIVSEPVQFDIDYSESRSETTDAYERLLGDALRGDQSLFARVDGVMEAWRIVSPIVDDPPAPHPYEKGSRGPAEADELVDYDWEWLTE
ncbi:MAG: glucose-6-phosphate dehydrogenase [Acidimicrobiia bacterium]|jgi:glucose-6-phosphate 1-dehydrogenase